MNHKRAHGTLTFLLFALSLYFPPPLSALLSADAENITVLIMDAVRYRNSGTVSLDLEVMEGEEGPGLYVKGKRFNVLQDLDAKTIGRLRIGQTIQVDFSGSIDDLGSGKLSLSLGTETIKIVNDPESALPIPFSPWEAFFPYILWLRLGFIFFFWVVVFILVCKPRLPKAL